MLALCHYDPLMWSIDDDLLCNGCGRILLNTGDRAHMMNLARGKRWHLYDGPTLTGKVVSYHLCEGCMSSPRAKLSSSAAPMDDDQTLF